MGLTFVYNTFESCTRYTSAIHLFFSNGRASQEAIHTNNTEKSGRHSGRSYGTKNDDAEETPGILASAPSQQRVNWRFCGHGGPSKKDDKASKEGMRLYEEEPKRRQNARSLVNCESTGGLNAKLHVLDSGPHSDMISMEPLLQTSASTA